jgi:hypothetical protein
MAAVTLARDLRDLRDLHSAQARVVRDHRKSRAAADADRGAVGWPGQGVVEDREVRPL